MSEYTIEFVNRGNQRIQVGAEQVILEAALDAGIPISFGCFYGDCTACTSRLLEGTVEQPEVTGLTAHLREQGLILLCVSKPRSDCVIAVGLDGAMAPACEIV